MRQYASWCLHFPFLFQGGQDSAASACGTHALICIPHTPSTPPEPRNRALTPSARLGALAGIQEPLDLTVVIVAGCWTLFLRLMAEKVAVIGVGCAEPMGKKPRRLVSWLAGLSTDADSRADASWLGGGIACLCRLFERCMLGVMAVAWSHVFRMDESGCTRLSKRREAFLGVHLLLRRMLHNLRGRMRLGYVCVTVSNMFLGVGGRCGVSS